MGFTRQRLAAQNVDIDKNYGSDVLGIPGTNGSDRLQGGYPDFVISGFSSLGNPNISNPFLFRDNQYLGSLNLSWVKGSHSFRFGAEINHYGINQFQPQIAYGPRGGFNFSGEATALKGGAAPNLYNGWADFLLGLPQAMGKDYQYINPSAVRESSYAIYARDQWQVTRKLTVDYGLRYELYPFSRATISAAIATILQLTWFCLAELTVFRIIPVSIRDWANLPRVSASPTGLPIGQ